MRTLSYAWCVAAFLVGCGPQDKLLSDDMGSEELVTDEAELAGELRASVGPLTVWVKTVLQPRLVNNEVRWVVQGRANQNLGGVFSFVPDDAYGQAVMTGPRTFEVSFDSMSELNTILSGLPVLVSVTPQGSTSSVATARVSFAPRFTSFTGSTRVFIGSAVTPVLVNDNLQYRGFARVPAGARLSASTLDDATITVTPRPTRGEFNVNFDFDNLRASLSETGVGAKRVEFVAAESETVLRNKLGVLVATATKLQLTTGDAYAVWPPQGCEDRVRRCIGTIRNGDFSACGSYREVNACSR
jgi:hypothetical protein